MERTLRRTTIALLAGIGAHMALAQVDRARDLVNPFIGTGGHGHTFPGACVPNGLVQLSPDTRANGYMDWDGCGGYHYSDSVIHGFSHTHLSGTGVADLCDVLLMPVAGEQAASWPHLGHQQAFDHATERANAGYYKVLLKGPTTAAMQASTMRRPVAAGESRGTAVELTATARTGVHRYSFPGNGQVAVVVDLAHRDKLLASDLRLVSPTEVVGMRRSSSWAKDQWVHFVIRFSQPCTDALDVPGSTMSTKRIFHFATGTSSLVVKVGISAVSIDGARRNLDAEVPGWDFDAVRKQAEAAWNTKLGRIAVEGGTREQQRVFYTALYHCYVAPYLFNDVDGQYRGMDGQVHQAEHNVYTVFSLWDTFRGLHPLMTILEPDMTRDWIRTFLLHYQQGGRLPVWELWGNETDCMIGYHSVSVIADAYQKGITGFDAALAMKAMRDGALRKEPGLNAYRTKGYISSEDQSESVSKTLEYAYDDACIERFGLLSGQRVMDLKPSMQARSRSPESLYDPGTGFFRARRNGGFIGGFDPFEVNFNYTEANAWQYSLFVPQDVPGLMDLHGGAAGLEAHLDKLFSAQSATSGREQADITGLIGQYAHGNEPSHHMAYLYDRVGRPDRTRAIVKQVMDELYRDSPDGLSGNEDCGQMSAWYVLSALGFYPISPGIDTWYDLGHPLFDKAVIKLPNGKEWSMTVVDDAKWRSSLPADTSDLLSEVPRGFTHAEVLSGGGLLFRKDRSPYTRYFLSPPGVLDGVYIKEPAQECPRPGAPVIEADAAAFSDSLVVRVIGAATDLSVTENGVTRAVDVCRPFSVHQSAVVSATWSPEYAPVEARYTRTDGSRTIKLASTYANQYAAGGDRALVDGLRGGPDFRTGEWQGYNGQDVQATIDLGREKLVKRVGLSMLQDQGAWIWYPAQVEFAWSTNGRKWTTVTRSPGVDRKADGGMHMELWTEGIGKNARYIKVTAKNAGPCPDWHPGKGGATWIFLDEVLIETE